MTRVAGDWLDNPRTHSVCAALSEYELYFVGGCVRNALLGVAVSDLDLSTSARPHQVIAAAEAAGLKAVPTGIDHGTVTVIADGVPYEVTTFRRDVATDGRRAVVAFADDIQEDALRRDFTMNALYARPDGTVVDPLEGLHDLRSRHVRFIEDAARRIQEDYLRILRFFRFHAWYGDPSAGLDPDGLAACAAHLDGLDTLSKERVGAEVLKLLNAPDPVPAVASMATSGVLGRVLPGGSADGLGPLVHLERGRTPDPIRRLAALGGEGAKDNLRLSKQDTRRLERLREAALGGAPFALLGYRLGIGDAMDAVLIRHALLSQEMPPSAEDEIARGARAVFPVKAADLAPLAGADLGARLKELENQWIASDFELTNAQLLE